MERWELKAGLEAILIAVERPVTLQVLAQALFVVAFKSALPFVKVLLVKGVKAHKMILST